MRAANHAFQPTVKTRRLKASVVCGKDYDMLSRLALLTALAVSVCGCGKTHSVSDSGKRADAAPLSSPYHLRYKSWSGTSPGAGFTSTSLTVVEVNLPAGKIRKLKSFARRPEAMLPYDDRSISGLMGKVPWQGLTAEKAEAFDKLIRAWLATSPPAIYNSPMALGKEDGHLTQLSVSWDTKTITTKLNPRGDFSADGPPRPPEEWKGLVDSLVGSERGRFEPAQGYRELLLPDGLTVLPWPGGKGPGGFMAGLRLVSLPAARSKMIVKNAGGGECPHLKPVFKTPQAAAQYFGGHLNMGGPPKYMAVYTDPQGAKFYLFSGGLHWGKRPLYSEAMVLLETGEIRSYKKTGDKG